MGGVAGWSWTYGGADGADGADGTAHQLPDPPAPDAPQQPATGFPVQADAETWLGESWRELLRAGVEQAWLRHEGQRIYGPVPLRPPR